MQTAPTTTPPSETVSPDKARRLIQSGAAPAGLRVAGHLRLAGDRGLRSLPAGLSAPSIDLSGCVQLEELPAGLATRRLDLSGCAALRGLPSGLRCYDLDLGHTPIRSLPADLRVENRLNLEDCTRLEQLPADLRVGTLILSGCTGLNALPEGLQVYFLDISGCTRLTGWPRHGSLRYGRLRARGCTQLRALPPWLDTLAQLDISGCPLLTDLPAALEVSAWIDIADSGLGWLPAGVRRARLLWRGVPIDERIAFRPETISAEEVLGQDNAELRRVLLERMGYQRFLAQARAQVRDQDRDPGGERRLLVVPLPDDEPLVCLAVLCPSTARQYLLRVPPNMRTCRQAAAWIAGFDSPDQYRPIVET